MYRIILCLAFLGKSEGANGAKPKVWGKPGKEDTHGRKSYAESVSSKGSTGEGFIVVKLI